MQELFNFIQDSYDPKYSNETDDPTTDETAVQNNTVVADINANTTQSNVTTQQTTIAPLQYDKSLRAADNKASVTNKTKDKELPLYDINNNLQKDLFSQTIDFDVKYATGLFTALGQNPVDANGKAIDISKLNELFQDPKQRKAIMDIAHKLEDDPNLSVEAKWNAQLNTYNANIANSAIPLIQGKIWDQMYQSATMVDAITKSKNKTSVVSATDLFVKDKDGKPGTEFLSSDEFLYVYLNKKIDQYNQFIKEKKQQIGGASSVITNANKPAYTQEGNRLVYNYNASNQARYADAESLLKQIVPNYKFPANPKDYTKQDKIQRAIQYKAAGMESELDPQNRLDALTGSGNVGNVPSKEAAYLNRTGGVVNFEVLPRLTSKNFNSVLTKLQTNLNKLGENGLANEATVNKGYNLYFDTKEKIINQYNKSDNTAIYKIKAELEGVFQNNKGGDLQSPGASLEFDWNAPYVNDKKRVAGGFKSEIKNFITAINYANQDNGEILFSYGELRNDKTGKSLLPKKNENVANDIKAITNQIKADITGGAQQIKKRKKAPFMLPQGTLTFSRKIFDDDGNEYHAFNVKLNPNYLNQRKFKGTAANPGISTTHPELLTKGFTIFVPSKYSSKSSQIAIEIEKANMLSNTEINLGLNGKSSTYFKGAGEINLTENKNNNTITMGGYVLNFNVDKNAYDTNRIKEKVFQKNQFFDIDRAMEQNIQIIKGIYIENENSKRDLIELKGVKDPKLLQQNK
jgi:hypothetical protein